MAQTIMLTKQKQEEKGDEQDDIIAQLEASARDIEAGRIRRVR